MTHSDPKRRFASYCKVLLVALAIGTLAAPTWALAGGPDGRLQGGSPTEGPELFAALRQSSHLSLRSGLSKQRGPPGFCPRGGQFPGG